jgi:hypothetical protein
MWCISSTAQARYIGRMLVAGVFCIGLALVASIGIRHMHVTGAAAWVLGILPALPVAWTLVVTGAYLNEEKDEFLRAVFVQAILAGMAATLSVTTAWGYLEGLVHAPHMAPTWVYPMFWIFVVLASPVVRLRYRS